QLLGDLVNPLLRHPAPFETASAFYSTCALDFTARRRGAHAPRSPARRSSVPGRPVPAISASPPRSGTLHHRGKRPVLEPVGLGPSAARPRSTGRAASAHVGDAWSRTRCTFVRAP